MRQPRMKLVRKLVARSAHSGALRAAALNHELRNHAMKNQPVVERPLFLLAGLFIGELFCAFGEPHEIRNRLGRLFLKQAHHDVPLRRFKNSVGSRWPAHAISLCTASSYTSLSVARHLASSRRGQIAFFPLVFSPALLLAKLRNMRSVMLPVPLVKKEQPVNGALAMFGVQRAPELVPARVHRVQQSLRDSNGRRFRIG